MHSYSIYHGNILMGPYKITDSETLAFTNRFILTRALMELCRFSLRLYSFQMKFRQEKQQKIKDDIVLCRGT